MKTPDQHDDLFSNSGARPDASNEIRFHAEDVACEPLPVHSVRSLGARLRAAREAKGMPLAECGRALKLPLRVLERLEAGEFGGADEYVFVRGALYSYARLAGVSVLEVENALRAVAPPGQPALVPTGNALRAPWLQRYGAAATYIVLTATVAVPLVWLGLRGGLDNQLTRIAPLDSAPPVASAPTQRATGDKSAPVATPPARQEIPLQASMTPFSAMQIEDDAASSPQPAASAAADPSVHVLSLNVRADSWVEVVDADGKTLESGILHAGDRRTYRSATPLNVTVGNADGVDVQSDGKSLSLAPYRRANVARFKAFDGNTGND